ncbi:MAG: hypothetical protein JO076_01930 [Verrucomicrobia bacterium]|nr:hypothetical protein [Verrucomicrobiota bacterium]
MKKHTTIECVIALLSIAVLSTSFIANAEDKEQATTMESIPAATAKAIKEQAPGAKITGLSKEEQDGNTIYGAKINVNGNVREISVDGNGKLVSNEEAIKLSSAPEAVQKAITENSKGGKVEKFEKVSEGGKVTFEALVSGNAKREEIVFSPDGKVIEREDKTKDND